MDNTSLESTVHWLSGVNGEVWVFEKYAKCNSRFTQNAFLAARWNEVTLRVVMAKIASLSCLRLFGAVWATLASLWGNIAYSAGCAFCVLGVHSEIR